MAGTILHCSLIVTQEPLSCISVGCHLVSGLGTVGLMKQHMFFFRAAPKQTVNWISTSTKPVQYYSKMAVHSLEIRVRIRCRNNHMFLVLVMDTLGSET